MKIRNNSPIGLAIAKYTGEESLLVTPAMAGVTKNDGDL